ncbi:hypothetical protein M426DRAFT_250065 [Hypoxylon sp. CI-4A]|nr:hypothetical protein M426DRAFT_250065 [Hypoxylon sp. CI-4A]
MAYDRGKKLAARTGFALDAGRLGSPKGDWQMVNWREDNARDGVIARAEHDSIFEIRHETTSQGWDKLATRTRVTSGQLAPESQVFEPDPFFQSLLPTWNTPSVSEPRSSPTLLERINHHLNTSNPLARTARSWSDSNAVLPEFTGPSYTPPRQFSTSSVPGSSLHFPPRRETDFLVRSNKNIIPFRPSRRPKYHITLSNGETGQEILTMVIQRSLSMLTHHRSPLPSLGVRSLTSRLMLRHSPLGEPLQPPPRLCNKMQGLHYSKVRRSQISLHRTMTLIPQLPPMARRRAVLLDMIRSPCPV